MTGGSYFVTSDADQGSIVPCLIWHGIPEIDSQAQILNAVFLIAEHKQAAVTDAEQAPLQQENSPAPAHSSRGKFLADSPLMPALFMFIETLKVRIKRWLLKL